MNGFAGKTVLITGAAGDIGGEMCRAFAAAGACIAALDRDAAVLDFAAELVQGGVSAAGAVADIGDAAAVGEAIESLREATGPIGILVNNAGGSTAGNLEMTDDVSWATDVASNLNGAFHCARAVVPDMKTAGGGAIVTIGSVNGTMTYGDPAYSAAKAGLVSLTKSLAVEYGRVGIRANLVSPGTVRTKIWDHRTEREPEIFEKLLRWYPLGRVAMPADISNAVMFLASDQAAAITGAVLPVDCGLSAGNIVMTREITLLEF